MTPYDHSPSALNAYEFVAYDHAIAVNDNPAVLEKNRTHLARRVGIGAAATLVALLAIGAVQHYTLHHAAVAAMEARQAAVPEVLVEPVKVTTSARDLSLPGTLSPFDAATIFARQSGYVAERKVDIGSKVKAGD